MKRAVFITLLLAAGIGAAEPALRPLRDPFVRPALATPAAAAAAAAAQVPAEPPPPPRLRALILNGTRSLANIDGDVVAAGEQIAGYTVLRIDPRGALIARGGKQLLLTIEDQRADRARPSSQDKDSP
ncbi:hypothetical protein IP91_00834 [Pseudoduganella lurida]|uniref:MSHA biogenesis protein MshK n=1 Tax=Pseudoduganella lurida TaxID=1036180 RepID=A0A562RL62_9BURK|nr:hypothetical protein [Pseudoduganella lurida]TWI69761.1 hypothetical protein IP91_00834 [Pseudoduganella lurida]